MINIHVITPFSRVENKDKLIKHLAPFNIQWYPIIYNVQILKDIPFLDFNRKWIHPVIVERSPHESIQHPYYKINRFLDTQTVKDLDYYSFLCDDDFYGEDFFDKIMRKKEGLTNKPRLGLFMTVVSMKRGLHTPKNGIVKHHTNTLIAAKENMKVGKVGLEQLIIRGDILRNLRFLNYSAADGLMAEMLEKYVPDVVYLSDVYVLFNYLEVGRW